MSAFMRTRLVDGGPERQSSSSVADATDPSYEVDVVIVGSGAGAMLAACRAHDNGQSVLIVEKTHLYGGTSAVSGGGLWIPNNDHIEGDGGSDSPEDALAYLWAATKGEVGEEKLKAFVRFGPEMLRYAEARTHVRYRANPYYADYYQHLPGAKMGYRALDAQPFDGKRLGRDILKMRETSPTMLIFGRVTMSTSEAVTMLSRAPGWRKCAWRVIRNYALDLPWRFVSRRDRRLNMGSALVGALRLSLMERNVPLWLNTPMKSLIVEDDQVVGITVEMKGRDLQVRAKRGVILASGGFESNQQMREQYLPQPTSAEWTGAPRCNTGDGINAGVNAGAALGNMQHAWWTPTVHVPGEEKPRGLFSERALPGCIVVNRLGKRFANEAQDYLDFVLAMYEDHANSGANLPAWMVFDARFRKKYNAGPLVAGSILPDRLHPRHWLGKVYFRGDTLEALAWQIGVNPEGLKKSVDRLNEFARTGVDLEFNKGGNAYDTFYGDHSVKPNPCLAPLEEGPFYAIRLDAGDIGTKGGLVTDEFSRVLRADGSPIPGLYATGNTSASVMGGSYPGAGATLGPAMTFGYIAANHIAGVYDAQRDSVCSDRR
ncbi:3-oxosteroid 1-dehydrogenase [Paraburkholderia sp. BL18I3N2]|uniref:FAD-binding protein n=1 Tax=Paraburkholderia sp. BL18I3N2 TaxID=1938799 RepID=UPI000D423D55|nr:FAD-binding protein [Paraburkholderia sp. BL18I3N2]PRX27372.1 3-oxosteroid 1-dehydrogenase [Paraburkholderia sp. BL18I3N2]